MRKSIMAVIIILLFISNAYAAEETKSLAVSTIVPVDYGVVFPADGLRLDRLYLALEAAGGDRNYLNDRRYDNPYRSHNGSSGWNGVPLPLLREPGNHISGDDNCGCWKRTCSPEWG